MTDDRCAGVSERFVVYHPDERTAGLAVRYDPDPGPHETEFTVEQLWPDRRADPVYVGDETRVASLIAELANALEVALEAEEADRDV